MEIKTLSLIDIGSNTIRLVVFSIDRHYSISEIQNVKIPARLAEYLHDEVMDEEGIRLLIRTLKSLKTISQTYRPEETFYLATAAIRRSKNREDILQRVKEEVGVDIRVLSEDEEAYYGNYAVRHTFDISEALTIDLGGGSTELVYYKDKEIQERISLPFGGVSLHEDFFRGKDHNDAKAVKEARKFIKKEVGKVDWLKDKGLPAIGIGGTARNIHETYQRQIDYPLAGNHGFAMTPDQVGQTIDLYLSSSHAEMEDLDGLSTERIDTIVPASLVFQTVLDQADSPSFILSARGLREGFIIEYLNENQGHPYSLCDVKGQTVVRTARKYRIPSVSVNQRVIIGDQLMKEIQKLDLLEVDDRELRLYYFALILYYVGAYIEDDSKSQHSFYILSNMNLFGFSHKERVALALLASFKNKSLFNQYISDFHSFFTEEEEELLFKMGSMIRFAEALNDTHINQIEDLTLKKVKKNKYEMSISYRGDVLAEKYRAEKHKNHIERVVKGDLTIHFNQPQND